MKPYEQEIEHLARERDVGNSSGLFDLRQIRITAGWEGLGMTSFRCCNLIQLSLPGCTE